MKSIHIYDLDGTLVDSSHRYAKVHNGVKWTIDLAHWIANSKLFHRDSLTDLAAQYKAQRADPEIYTIWATARQADQVIQSAQWLSDNLGMPDKFFFRPQGCEISGAVLKSRQLHSFLSLKQFQNVPRFFYEDNLDYLDAVCNTIDATPIYIQSEQGY